MVAVAPISSIENLLAPIQGENQAGEDLTYNPLLDEIREARRADDNLEQGDWKRELKSADWHKVVTLTSGALATRSKDLQLAAWLTEALAKLHGMTGLSEGLVLCRGLVEQYWEHLYPAAEDGNLEDRASTLAWLDRQLGSSIKEVTIGRSLAGANHSYLDYETYNEGLKNLNQIKDDYEKNQAKEQLDRWNSEWLSAKQNGTSEFYEGLLAEANKAWDEFQALDLAMDRKFGTETPGLGRLKKSLEEIRSLVEKIAIEKRPVPALPEITEVQDEAAGAFDGNATVADASLGPISGHIRSRTEALRRLSEVAEYFSKTEPHSPVSYLIQRAIKWGQMPLDSWLEDVIKDESVLDRLRDILGLKTNAKP